MKKQTAEQKSNWVPHCSFTHRGREVQVFQNQENEDYKIVWPGKRTGIEHSMAPFFSLVEATKIAKARIDEDEN